MLEQENEMVLPEKFCMASVPEKNEKNFSCNGRNGVNEYGRSLFVTKIRCEEQIKNVFTSGCLSEAKNCA